MSKGLRETFHLACQVILAQPCQTCLKFQGVLLLFGDEVKNQRGDLWKWGVKVEQGSSYGEKVREALIYVT